MSAYHPPPTMHHPQLSTTRGSQCTCTINHWKSTSIGRDMHGHQQTYREACGDKRNDHKINETHTLQWISTNIPGTFAGIDGHTPPNMKRNGLKHETSAVDSETPAPRKGKSTRLPQPNKYGNIEQAALNMQEHR